MIHRGNDGKLGHSRRMLSGIHLAILFGDDGREKMDPCHVPQGLRRAMKG